MKISPLLVCLFMAIPHMCCASDGHDTDEEDQQPRCWERFFCCHCTAPPTVESDEESGLDLPENQGNLSAEDKDLMAALPTDSCFKDYTQPHGLNLPLIHRRMYLVRKFTKKGGEDFSTHLRLIQKLNVFLHDDTVDAEKRKVQLDIYNGRIQNLGDIMGIVPDLLYNLPAIASADRT